MSHAAEVCTLTVADGSSAALWVSFDPRCETDQADDGCYLAFYSLPPSETSAGAGGSGGGGGGVDTLSGGGSGGGGLFSGGSGSGMGTVTLLTGVQQFKSAAAAHALLSRSTPFARFSGPSHMFQPFVVQTSCLQYAIFRGRSKRGASVAAGGGSNTVRDGGWGVQITVTPLSGVAWGHACDVPSSPAMLWGARLLEFLTSGGLSHGSLCRGTVHNGATVGVVIDYLRTSGAPFKERVVGLLLRLLAQPEYLLITPSHVDYGRRRTDQAVRALLTGPLPAPHTKAEWEVLQPLLALPLRSVEILRQLTDERVREATKVGLLFLPKSLQLLAEVVAAADIAIRRARMQMHLLAATKGDIFGAKHYPRIRPAPSSVALRDGPSSIAVARAAYSPLNEPVSAAVAQEGRILLAQGSRADAAVPVFDAERAYLTPPHKWIPTMIINVGPPEGSLSNSAALVYLREILTCVITGRRMPDAWVCRALMRAMKLPDVSQITSDRLLWAHAVCGKFTPAADYAVGAWMAALASKAQTDGLSLDPASLEVREADVASFPVLGRYTPQELRLRASMLRVINVLLQKCIHSIDMTPHEAVEAGTAAGSGDAGAAAAGGADAGASAVAAAPSASASASSSSSSSSATGWPVLGTLAPLHRLSSLPLGAILRRLPHLVLVDAKERIVNQAIDNSTTPGLSNVKISLDNRAAMACADLRITDAASTMCTFAQIYRHCTEARVTDRQLRCKLSEREFLWEVRFVGLGGSAEDGLDWGGLYREVLERSMSDLFGEPHLQGINLFSLSPNAHASRVEDEGGAGAGAGGGAVGGAGAGASSSSSSAAADGSGSSAAAAVAAAAEALALASAGGVDGSFLPCPLYGLAATCAAELASLAAGGGGGEGGAHTAAGAASGAPSSSAALSSSSAAAGGKAPSSSSSSAAAGATNASSSTSATAGGLLLGSAQLAAAASLPASTLSLASSMYVFIGKLMGISVRTKACLDFDLSIAVWKMLADEPLGLPELTAMDGRLGALLQRILDFAPPSSPSSVDNGPSGLNESFSGSSSANNSSSGGAVPDKSAGGAAAAAAAAAEAAFASQFAGLVFVMPDSTIITGNPLLAGEAQADKVAAAAAAAAAAPPSTYAHLLPVAATGGGSPTRQHAWLPLLPGGAGMPVTYANRGRYVSLVLGRVWSLLSFATRAMRAGLAAIIPERALRLCGWRDLQRLVCGEVRTTNCPLLLKSRLAPSTH